MQSEFERVQSTHLNFSRETLTIPLQENKLFTPVNVLNQISFSQHSIFFLSPGPSLHFYIITFVQLLPIAQLLFDLLFLLQIVVFLSHLTCL